MADTGQCRTVVNGATEFSASGHLLVDEKIKLKSDIYWNVASDQVVGFVSDTKAFDLGAALKAMLNDTENGSVSPRPLERPMHASNQHQWKNQLLYMSINGVLSARYTTRYTTVNFSSMRAHLVETSCFANWFMSLLAMSLSDARYLASARMQAETKRTIVQTSTRRRQTTQGKLVRKGLRDIHKPSESSTIHCPLSLLHAQFEGVEECLVQ
jgi:hypothetical protein